MALTYQLFNAAHTYGLDNMGVTSALASANDRKIGTAVDDAYSWAGDEPPIGQPVSASLFMSGGYTVGVNFTLTSETSAVISAISLLRTSTNELLYSVTGNLSVTEDALEQIAISAATLAGNDNLIGNSYNNALRGYAGNDRIDGDAGTDTVYLPGTSTQTTVTRNGSTMTISGPDGTDTLLNVERLRFDDKIIAFDTGGTAGQAYRLYQAAFNRTPDASGLAYQINTLDNGWGLAAIAQNFINSPEFVKTYGSLSNTQFVTQLYANVLHRAPDAGGLAYHVGTLDSGQLNRAQVLVGFSESPENQAALIGVISNGMSYSTTYT
jgi:serralysin